MAPPRSTKIHFASTMIAGRRPPSRNIGIEISAADQVVGAVVVINLSPGCQKAGALQQQIFIKY